MSHRFKMQHMLILRQIDRLPKDDNGWSIGNQRVYDRVTRDWHVLNELVETKYWGCGVRFKLKPDAIALVTWITEDWN